MSAEGTSPPGGRTDSPPAEILLTALAVVAVTLSPFTIALGRPTWFAALWLDVALTALAAGLVWTRRGIGCFEIFVPFVATIGVLASTAARPEEVGPWIPLLQVAGTLAVVAGARARQPRGGTGRK